MANVVLNFKNAPLPNPPANFDAQYLRQVIRVLEIYFDQLDSWNLQVYNALIGLGMDPFSPTSLDAFGRLRVSQPYTLFDSQNRYAADNQFDVSTTGTGTTTFLSNEAAIKMEVTGVGVGSVTRQTYRVFPYQPGKGLLVLATFVMDSSTSANLTQQVGYFNDSNGVFFKRTGSTNSFVLRSSSTPTPGTPSDVRTVSQANWNGDKLDGTGESGLTLDTSKAQILWYELYG